MIPNSGWIFLNKPKDIISRSLLNILQKKMESKKHGLKLGFAGTLDPFATGILPIAIGNATRLIEYLMMQEKEYIFEMKFGIKTDTYDITGSIERSDNKKINKEDILKIIHKFIGEILQKPPVYSAVKINGRRACDIVREDGIMPEIQAKYINIYELELLSFDYVNQIAKLRTVCSSGTYVRSLIVDMATELETVATALSIHRSKIGNISEESSINYNFLLNSIEEENLNQLIAPLDAALDIFLSIDLDDEQALKLRNGLHLPDNRKNVPIVKFYNNNKFLGIGEILNEHIIPRKIMYYHL